MFALLQLLCMNYKIAMETAVCIGIANCAANVFYLVILALKISSMQTFGREVGTGGRGEFPPHFGF